MTQFELMYNVIKICMDKYEYIRVFKEVSQGENVMGYDNISNEPGQEKITFYMKSEGSYQPCICIV